MHCLRRIFLCAACFLAAGTSIAYNCEEYAAVDTVSIGLVANGAAVSLDVTCYFVLARKVCEGPEVDGTRAGPACLLVA